ncbi:malonate decarboxylase holo-[acyl-carrier-protein] synthase [Noviherbaspirillum malthae]|uniref:malonate decarboxylase holo-[acyl-carrier-protein] synthase n=1 Tax=Noviherbaspirillum malthae TaxID=1260987 RepID=UPI0018905488|nr:malonate decarboxylase holo-[acyl-carrier-protein] synthase [Noviherbaspirillum malthae]
MLARHSLVWLHPQGWQEAEAAASAAAAASTAADCSDAFRQWRQADWPLIARRPDADAGSDDCCLGLAMPPDPATGFKRRIGLRVQRSGVRRIAAPLPVASTVDRAPQLWRTPLSRLSEQAEEAGMALHVFGSLALQTLTGRSYLTPASDIDLLFIPASARQLEEGMAMLGAAAEQLPLDGEVVFPGGQAVAWKEWRNAAGAARGMRVLAKDMHGVRLASTAELLGSLEAGQ